MGAPEEDWKYVAGRQASLFRRDTQKPEQALPWGSLFCVPSESGG